MSRVMRPRDAAVDMARALAILGMFVIHAVLVLGSIVPRDGVASLILWWCDGRAAATFVTLAGFGVARLAAKYSPSEGSRLLRRRALLLAVLGVLNHAVWPGDILRVYGVALLLAPLLLQWSARTRVALGLALAAIFPLLMSVIDWTHHWDLETLTYVGAWTPSGFVRSLFYDGFRPVVPWLGFFLMGTVLAEQPLHEPRMWRRLLWAGAALTAMAVGASAALNQWLVRVAPALDALTREGLVGTTSLPPLPLFLLSAVGTTWLVLGTMLALVPHLSTRLIEPLVATGRRALTWYLWHIVLLMTLYVSGAKQSLPPGVAIGVGLMAFAGAVAWSHTHRAEAGWIERQMRRWSEGGTTRMV